VLYTRKTDKCRSLILSNLHVSYLGAHREGVLFHNKKRVSKLLGSSLEFFFLEKKKKEKAECLFLREWPELESNQRHKDFQSSALPTELSSQLLKKNNS
jgi:hypothetical protein